VGDGAPLDRRALPGLRPGPALGATTPVYNLIVIASSLVIAVAIALAAHPHRFRRIIRATADNREMAEPSGGHRRLRQGLHARTALGTLAARSSFRDGGDERDGHRADRRGLRGRRDRWLGSMRGAFVGALVVGILRSIAISGLSGASRCC